MSVLLWRPTRHPTNCTGIYPYVREDSVPLRGHPCDMIGSCSLVQPLGLGPIPSPATFLLPVAPNSQAFFPTLASPPPFLLPPHRPFSPIRSLAPPSVRLSPPLPHPAPYSLIRPPPLPPPLPSQPPTEPCRASMVAHTFVMMTGLPGGVCRVSQLLWVVSV